MTRKIYLVGEEPAEDRDMYIAFTLAERQRYLGIIRSAGGEPQAQEHDLEIYIRELQNDVHQLYHDKQRLLYTLESYGVECPGDVKNTLRDGEAAEGSEG